MRIKHKLRLWVFFPLLVILAAFSILIGAKHAEASSFLSQKQVESLQFYWISNGFIQAKLPGTTRTFDFINPDGHNDVNVDEYVNTGDFCTTDQKDTAYFKNNKITVGSNDVDGSDYYGDHPHDNAKLHLHIDYGFTNGGSACIADTVDRTLLKQTSVTPDDPGYLLTSDSIKNLDVSMFKITDGGHITLNFKTPKGSTSINFTDTVPEDKTRIFQASDGKMCGSPGDLEFNSPDQLKDPLPLQHLNLWYWDTTGSTIKCVKKDLVSDLKMPISMPNTGTPAAMVFKWVDAKTIQSVSSGLTLTAKSSDTSGNTLIANDTSDCGGWAVHLASDNKGVLYQKDGEDSGNSLPSSIPACTALKGNRTVLIFGTRPTTTASLCEPGDIQPNADGSCPPGTTLTTVTPNGAGTGTTTGDFNKQCEDRAVGFSLKFLLCPMLAGANWLSDTLTTQFEKLLEFTLQDKSQTVDPAHKNITSSSISEEGLTGLHQAWAAIRLIASSIIIIFLLIMIVSEAIGGGPFDAYTIRKVLPKLIMAVILMQLSWNICIWVVNAVDDLGHGLTAIMYQPFGGQGQMNLISLLNNAHIGLGTDSYGGAIWIGLIGVVVATFIAPVVIIMFAFGAIMALMTAVVTLEFRKIIIILAIVLAPLALMANALPGTQKYWKTWQDTFIKSLFMYPLVVAIVAGGRIFAYVAGTTGNGTFLNFITVFIGFFGPLFILPKCWKWGGSMMKATGEITGKGLQGTFKPVKEYGDWRKGISQWSQGRQKRKAAQEQRAGIEFSQNLGRDGIRGWRARKSIAGILNPTDLTGDKEAQLRQDIQRTAGQTAEDDATKRGKEAVSSIWNDESITQGQREQRLMDLATSGNAHEREAAIGKAIENEMYGEMGTAGVLGSPDWERTLRKNPDLDKAVGEKRADLLPRNVSAGRSAASLFAGEWDPATRTVIAGRGGINIGQLATQKPVVLGRAAAELTTMAARGAPADMLAIDSAYARIQTLARDRDSSKRLLGTESEQHLTTIIQLYNNLNPPVGGVAQPVSFSEMATAP